MMPTVPRAPSRTLLAASWAAVCPQCPNHAAALPRQPTKCAGKCAGRALRPRLHSPSAQPVLSPAGVCCTTGGTQVMLTYIHIGRWCVSEPPACWGLPASPSSSSAARSWPDRPSCHRQRALSCGQWSCSLGSSTQSAPFRPFSAAIDDHEMTAAGRPGSWAESPSPHTLSCSPSWCSLDY